MSGGRSPELWHLSGGGYDAVGRIVRLEDSGGTVVTYEYDAAGRLIRATDETTGNTVEYSYDAAGRCLRCERC